MATVLQQYGPPDVQETAKFCEMLDNFFDCLNVRSLTESKKKRKPFLTPYEDVNDIRFQRLEETFLGYFQNWEENIENRPGNFTKTARGNMFISWQTYAGLKITVYSVIEAVKFLLSVGMPYVLTERFCQDQLEEYFGNQRTLGRRSDNPDIQKFGYNNNTIRIQRNVSHASGNTRGRFDKKRAWENITEYKVPKRRASLLKTDLIYRF